MAERGSFMWMLVSITQIWLALKLMDDLEGWLTSIIGVSGAACVMVAIVVFRQEQSDLLLNPMKEIQREVHPDQISKQGKGVWIGVLIWFIVMIFGSVAL